MSVQAKLNDLTNRRQTIELLGGKEAVDKVHANGKMTSRERVDALLDDNSFVEVGAFVKQRATDFNLEATDLAADGVVTGYGTIEGRLVYVYSQDSTVLGGAIGEMHAKKIVTVYDMALKMGAPVIGLMDTAGLRLQESTDALDAFGQIYSKQAAASGVIPQITAVLGNCGGGAAVIASLSDFTFMTTEKSALYVNSPNTLGDTKDADAYGSASFNAKEAGTVDFVCENEEAVFVSIKELVEMLPANNAEEAPAADIGDDLNRISAELNSAVSEAGINGLDIITAIADGSKVLVVKAGYGVEVVTALGTMNGMTVGFVGNITSDDDIDGRLTVAGLKKAADFVSFCDAFSIPVVTVSDVIGYAALAAEEKAGLAIAAAKLTAAFANASVPKVSVIANRAMGSAYVSFNSKHIGADVVYAWPTASIGMMDAENAVKIIYAEEIANAEVAGDLIAAKTTEFAEKQNSPYAAASHGYVDDIIEPAATRKRVIVALEMLYTKSVAGVDRKHSTR